MKHGAWTPCPKCKHTPEDPEDKAKHVMTSGHYFSKADLEGISARIQEGKPLHFDQKQVEQFATTMVNINPEKTARFFVLGFYVVMIVVLVLGLYLIVRFVLR
jgi:hypothetical protein